MRRFAAACVTISATTRVGVRDWTCTSYSTVTARGLSASPSPTKWYPWQELHLHASRRCGLNAVRLLFRHRGVGVLYGCRSRHDGLKGRLLRRLLTVQEW